MGKNKLFKKLNGYQRAPRARFKWLIDKSLTQEELLLYELGIAITDWDENHVETYGSFEATNQELADILGWTSDTTAGRYRKSLIKKRIFLIREDGRIEARGFEKWQLRKRQDAKTQEQDAGIEDKDANIHEETAKIEEKQPRNVDYSLSSFKGHLGSQENLEIIPDDELVHIAEKIFGVEEGDTQ